MCLPLGDAGKIKQDIAYDIHPPVDFKSTHKLEFPIILDTTSISTEIYSTQQPPA